MADRSSSAPGAPATGGEEPELGDEEDIPQDDGDDTGQPPLSTPAVDRSGEQPE